VQAPDAEFHEASLLALDAAKSEHALGWRNRLDFRQSVEWTVDWYAAVRDGQSPREISETQLLAFVNR